MDLRTVQVHIENGLGHVAEGLGLDPPSHFKDDLRPGQGHDEGQGPVCGGGPGPRARFCVAGIEMALLGFALCRCIWHDCGFA